MDTESRFEHRFDGSVLEDNIIYEAEMANYDLKPKEILEPFFNKIWDVCGLGVKVKNLPNRLG